ncbi:MAG: hypothetical protein IKT77_05500, partial [Paludibacteraceae bacterium]|nr:hypothetical protein [Paludibacteraceae bacterium]
MKLPFKLKDLTTNRGIATIYLVTMCTQFVAIEGYGVSNVKVALMALAPFLLIFKVPYMTKATVWCSLYMVVVLFCAFQQDYVRFSTLGYLGMFLITYIVYYNLLYKKHAFSLMYFIRLLRIMILAYVFCLLAQQVFVLIGIRNFPLINLYNQHFLAIDKLPTWTQEPSSSARILGVLYYAYLKCCEIVEEEKLSLARVFEKPHRWITIGFLYTMTMMGSGTAFISLMILAMYFLKTKTLWYVVPIFIGLYFTLPLMNIKQLDRAVNVINATLTLDAEEVRRADGSASSRIAPILNTLNMDLSKSDTWFGKGTHSKEVQFRVYVQQTSKIGNIEQYGLLSFIVMQICVLLCAFRFLSLSTMFWGLVFGF